MNLRRSSVAVATMLLPALAAPIAAHGGPLDPPSGPVAPTFKTLTEVEPRIAINGTNTPGDADATPSQFKITQPGSYYLTGNITGVSGKIGIEIAASDVTLDLNGFRLLGVAGSLGGITVTGTQSDVAIRNGVLRSWGSSGISANTCTGLIVDDVRSIGNTGHGIFAGPDAMIRRCYCNSNTQSGISASVTSEITECVTRLNGASGIITNDHASVRGCVANSNTTAGLTLGAGSVVDECIAAQNGAGISAGSGLLATNTLSRNNTGNGFFCFGASYINCISTTNGAAGFDTDSALLTSCRATSNHGEGISGGSNSMALGSLTISNDLFGMHFNSGYALNNHCANDCLNASELREIKFDTRGRADSNHLNTFNSSLWGLGGPQGALFIRNSMNGGFVLTFGGTEGPDIDGNNINTTSNPSGNYDLP